MLQENSSGLKKIEKLLDKLLTTAYLTDEQINSTLDFYSENINTALCLLAFETLEEDILTAFKTNERSEKLKCIEKLSSFFSRSPILEQIKHCSKESNTALDEAYQKNVLFKLPWKEKEELVVADVQFNAMSQTPIHSHVEYRCDYVTRGVLYSDNYYEQDNRLFLKNTETLSMGEYQSIFDPTGSIHQVYTKDKATRVTSGCLGGKEIKTWDDENF